jgi:hypothetical protein
MNKIIKFLALALIPALIISSCFLSKSDSESETATPAGTFTKQVCISGIFHKDLDTKNQYLYTANEIGASGRITKIRLRQNTPTTSPVVCPNVTVKMGHTNRSTLLTSYYSNVEQGKGSELTVLNNATITIPVGDIGNWIEFPFDTAFEFNGVDNLIVDFERSSKCPAFVCINRFCISGCCTACFRQC